MLITEPTVFKIAETKFDWSKLEEWANFNEFTFEGGQPLGRLHSNIWFSGGPQYLVEFAGRHCYRSWFKGRPHDEYMRHLINSGHHSVLEHANFTFTIQGVSRTLTHELVRHRVGVAISQESQRYVDAKDINFVIPPLLLEHCEGDLSHSAILKFERDCQKQLDAYLALQEELGRETKLVKRQVLGVKKKKVNEAARALLPGCAETRLVWTANARTLRHVIELRGEEGADAEMQRFIKYLEKEVPEWVKM